MPEKIKQYINTTQVTCPICDFEYPDKAINQDSSILCGNCGKVFDATIIRIATGRRTQGKDQSLPHDEFTPLYTTKQHIEQSYDLTTIKNLDQAISLYNNNLINAPQLDQLIREHEWKPTAFIDGFTDGKWVTKDRNPFYKDGNNKSRQHGFTYGPYHANGIVFQVHVKIIIRKMIDLSYGAIRKLYGKERTNVLQRWMIKKAMSSIPGTIDYLNTVMVTRYDRDAFVFDDPFLTAIRNLMHQHIQNDFNWTHNTQEPFDKMVDLVLAIMKEDLPYSWGAKNVINDLITKYPNGFELTEMEKEHEKYLRDLIQTQTKKQSYLGL